MPVPAGIQAMRAMGAVERLWETGRQCGVPQTAETCQAILKRREALWTFVQVVGVEPPHTAAERAMRPGVPWRQGSVGIQSEAGSRFGESLRTVVATLKQPPCHVLASLPTACEAALWGEAAPSLLPTNAQKSHAAV